MLRIATVLPLSLCDISLRPEGVFLGVGAKSYLSLWERWHRAAMTERVKKTPEAVFSLRGPVQGKIFRRMVSP